MPHFYERNIVDIKNEYTTFLLNILTPLIYEGMNSLYKEAEQQKVKMTEELKEKNSSIVPSVLKIFQSYLKETPKMNTHLINNETDRIRTCSKCADLFDDLIRAVIKSYIILLTYNSSENKCYLVKEKHHEKTDIPNFIHKCYVECARSFYNNPELFLKDYQPVEIKRNQRESFELIRKSIREAIRKTLPMKLILKE